MGSPEHKEKENINDKRKSLKKIASSILVDDPELVSSFGVAIDSATDEEIEEQFQYLVKNPDIIRRIAISKQQLQALQDLQQSIQSLEGIMRNI